MTLLTLLHFFTMLAFFYNVDNGDIFYIVDIVDIVDIFDRSVQ